MSPTDEETHLALEFVRDVGEGEIWPENIAYLLASYREKLEERFKVTLVDSLKGLDND